jgi:TRAP-type C4-dicarboxylate transport system permease small subunit
MPGSRAAVTRGLDALTETGAKAAALCVAASALLYTGEVVARYFFAAPLNWSGDVSSYLLCACLFLALPKVTSEGAHVAVTIVPDALGEGRRRRYLGGVRLATGLACLLTAGFVVHVGLQHYEMGVLTSQATQIPKWLLAALAVWGFGLSALHLLLARARVVERSGGA